MSCSNEAITFIVLSNLPYSAKTRNIFMVKSEYFCLANKVSIIFFLASRPIAGFSKTARTLGFLTMYVLTLVISLSTSFNFEVLLAALNRAVA